MSDGARLRFLGGDVGGSPSWRDACEEFLADLELRHFSGHTVAWYQCVLGPFGRYLQAEAGTDDASRATEEHVRGFLKLMAAEGSAGRGGVGPRRLNHYREGIRRFYDWLEDRGYVSCNPAANIRKIRQPKRLIPVLTDDQVAALVQQPDRSRFVGLRDFCFLLLLIDTGVRLSEALNLRVADVDLEQGIATVIGKGDKQRRVGLSARLVVELKHYLRKREAALAGIGRPDSPWVFPNDVGGRLSSKTTQQRVRKYGERAGIRGVRVSPHTLRHTYALNFVRSGGDPFTLQKILGHSSLETTRRYCELASADVLRRQRELSPLQNMNLKGRGGPRIQRRPMDEW